MLQASGRRGVADRDDMILFLNNQVNDVNIYVDLFQ